MDLRVRTAHRQVGKPSPPFLMLDPSLEMGDGKVTEVTVGGDVVLGGLLANGEHLVESLHVVQTFASFAGLILSLHHHMAAWQRPRLLGKKAIGPELNAMA